MPDAATITIGGITVLTVQMTIMAMIRKQCHVGSRTERYFDWLNWPVAFVLVGIANPPWPWWSFGEWQSFVGLALALATLASVTAKKASDAQPKPAPDGVQATEAA